MYRTDVIIVLIVYDSVRILRVCPWYEDLEPVLRDRPMARPMRAQETLGPKTIEMSDFVPPAAAHDEDLYNVNDLDAIEGWHATPPPQGPEVAELDIGDHVLDPNLKELGLSQVDDLVDRPPPLPNAKIRSVTPCASQPQPKRRRSSAKLEKSSSTLSLDSPDPTQGRDVFGLKAMLGNIPTKNDRVVAQQELVLAQERITTKMTDKMCDVLLSNRALEMETKKELARDDLEAKKSWPAMK